VSAEEAAIAAIESAEAMTLANLNLIRSVKQLLPKKYQSVADPVIDLQTNIVRAEAKVAKKVTRKASAYNLQYKKQYAILKKKHPRSSFSALAKKAHKATRKVMK